jgi:hypothetical protein
MIVSEVRVEATSLCVGAGRYLRRMDLNPVEYLWAHWKHHERANVCPKDVAEANAIARAERRRTQRHKTSSQLSGSKLNCQSDVTVFVKNQ